MQCVFDTAVLTSVMGTQKFLDVKTISSARLFLTFVCCVTALTCAAASKSSMAPLGNDTYSITREAKTGFDRDVDRLKDLAKQDAAKFCESQGKQLKVIDLTAKKPFFGTGYANATIVFKALSPGSAELAASSGAAETAPTPKQYTNTSDLYNDLLKLDELRQKKILTEEEFQSEKQKVLNRSK